MRTSILDNHAKYTVKDARLYEEKDKYYIDITYIIEDEYRVKELHIPKVRIPLEYVDIITHDMALARGAHPQAKLLCGPDCELLIENTDNDGFPLYFTEKIVKEKAVKMTVEEIEKKLGHKIEIISNKEE